MYENTSVVVVNAAVAGLALGVDVMITIFFLIKFEWMNAGEQQRYPSNKRLSNSYQHIKT
jgi:hypothetical protein